MKIISSLLLLLPVIANAQTIADWHVTVDTVTAQGLTFTTGAGAGGNVNIKIGATDQCRMESATRTTVGEMYPTNAVGGLAVTPTIGAVGSGTQSISWNFIEGINENANIYTEAPDGLTADVVFCVLTGLYDGTSLIDFAEVKMTYSIDLVTNIPTLTGYTVTQAEAFQDEGANALGFDGTLLAYFCDKTTHVELTDPGTGTKTNQGSLLNVCFKTQGGQFLISDITEFTVKNALAAEPSQVIVTGGNAGPLYSTKNCIDDTINDENICVVEFLLKADFYDFTALTLDGTGTVVLELGGVNPARRQLRQKVEIVDASRRQLANTVSEDVAVKPHSFEVEQVGAGSSASTAMSSIAAIGAIAGAALAL